MLIYFFKFINFTIEIHLSKSQRELKLYFSYHLTFASNILVFLDFMINDNFVVGW